MEQQPTKDKVSPSQQQKEILQVYRNENMMISTGQHDLIKSCQTETGLPLAYIKSWIGNENTKAKGKRKGGNDYKPRGKPRKISGYNIFCSENKAPDNVRAKGLVKQNKWWKNRWEKVQESEKSVYNQRACEANKRSATKALIGEDIIYRQNYLMTKLSNLCEELGEAGVDVIAFGAQDEDGEIISGSYLGMKYLRSRRTQTTRIGAQLREFIHHARQKEMTKEPIRTDRTTAPAVDGVVQLQVTAVDDAAQTENIPPQAVDNIQPTPRSTSKQIRRKKPRTTKKRVANGTSTMSPTATETTGTDTSSPQAAVQVQGKQQATKKQTKRKKSSTAQSTTAGSTSTLSTTARVNNGTDSIPALAAEQLQEPQQTALDILLPLSNGIDYGAHDGDDAEPSISTQVFTISTDEYNAVNEYTIREVETVDIPVNIPAIQEETSKKSLRKSTKRKRTTEDIVGKEIEHLWVTNKSPYKRWYEGSVVERDGDIYRIKYKDKKKPLPFPVSSVEKWTKAKTFLIL